MTKWEYKWVGTYWIETEREQDYLTRIRYGHRWQPDSETERPFPDEEGLDRLGSEGWELVAVAPAKITHQTVISPQGNHGYTDFTIHSLAFKRPTHG